MERKLEATVTGPDVGALWDRMKARGDTGRWWRDHEAEGWNKPRVGPAPLVFRALHRPEDPTRAWFFRDVDPDPDAIQLTEIVAKSGATGRPAVYNSLKRSVMRDVVEPLTQGLDVQIDIGIEDDGEDYPEDYDPDDVDE